VSVTLTGHVRTIHESESRRCDFSSFESATLQKRFDFGCGHRGGVQPTLHFVTAQRFQCLELRVCFDPFSGGIDAKFESPLPKSSNANAHCSSKIKSMIVPDIRTSKLELISWSPDFMRAALQGEAISVGYQLPEQFPGDLKGLLNRRLA
jgi:hypothetical protein